MEGGGAWVLQYSGVKVKGIIKGSLFKVWNFSFRDFLGKYFFFMGALVEEVFFLGGVGERVFKTTTHWRRTAHVCRPHSSILDKQMRKIDDKSGTIPSNETQTLKFPLLRFVSSKNFKPRKFGAGFFVGFVGSLGVFRVIQQHYSQHTNHCYIYQLLFIVKNAAFISDVPHPGPMNELNTNGLGFGVKPLA